jgi:hypothetical protein
MSNDFWAFRTMVAPVIIQVIFWIGAVTIFLTGIISVIMGLASGKAGVAVWGIMLAIAGPIGVRIYCEILIVLFRINETLTEIEHAVERLEPEPRGP